MEGREEGRKGGREEGREEGGEGGRENAMEEGGVFVRGRL